MNNLREFIGQTVVAYIEDESGEFDHVVKCKVEDVTIVDDYFYDKNEPIYIEVNLFPIEDLPKGVEYEHFHNVDLGNIRSY